MFQVARIIKDSIRAPIGVNVLHNDYRAALRIARELGLSFIQLDVYVDRVRTDFEHTEGVQFDVYVDIDELTDNPVDPRRVEEVMEAVYKAFR